MIVLRSMVWCGVMMSGYSTLVGGVNSEWISKLMNGHMDDRWMDMFRKKLKTNEDLEVDIYLNNPFSMNKWMDRNMCWEDG